MTSASQKQKRETALSPSTHRSGVLLFFGYLRNTSRHNLCQPVPCDPQVAVSPSNCLVLVKAKDGMIAQVPTCPSLGLAEKPAAHPTDWPRSNRPNGCAAFLPSFSSPKFREGNRKNEAVPRRRARPGRLVSDAAAS
jgi:hypothetical protein